MRARKSLIFIFVPLAVLLACLIGISVGSTAYAAMGDISGVNSYTIKRDDIFLKTSDTSDYGNFRNEREGARYGIRLRSEMTNFNYVEYSLIKLTTNNDEVTMNPTTGDIYLNGANVNDIESAYCIKDGVKQKKKVNKSEMWGASGSYTYQFDIDTYEWCAIVLKVNYESPDKKDGDFNYYSDVYYCQTIDKLPPKAECYDWIDNGGGITTFRIKITDVSGALSATSGIKDFRFIRKNGDNKEDFTKNIVNISKSAFVWYFDFVSSGVASDYYVYAGDNVDSWQNSLVVSVNSDDYIRANGQKFEESNIINTMAAINNKLYNPALYSELKRLYDTYRYMAQLSNRTEAGEEKAELQNKIDNTLIPNLWSYYLTCRSYYEKAQNGKKDWTLKLYNSEYLSGDLELLNVEEAYSSLLFGETMTIKIVVASFDSGKVDKKAEMKVAGIATASKILSFNIEAVNNFGEEYKLAEPLKIKVPLQKYESVCAVSKSSDGAYNTLEIKEFSDYVIVSCDQGNGIMTVFVDGSSFNKNYLWLLTLLIIPLGAAVFFIYKKRTGKTAKNGKKSKKKDSPTSVSETAVAAKKPDNSQKPPKNKSKKKKKK